MNRCPYCNSDNFKILETKKGTDFLLHQCNVASNGIYLDEGLIVKVKACKDCKGVQLVMPNLK